jgi:hypothetical protein
MSARLRDAFHVEHSGAWRVLTELATRYEVVGDLFHVEHLFSPKANT